MESLEAEVGQLQEKLRAARDKHNKLEIVASDRGMIHELNVHTIGGVIRAGDTLASIVPTDTALVVDAKVHTTDRDQIYPGMSTRVRFTAFNQRTTPELFGRVARIASDQSTDKENTPPYYWVRIELLEGELARLGELEIKPGMPAEAMMTAQDRTVLSYFLKPMTDQLARAFRDE
jgi:membrane fusion protein, type I secretion system